MYVSITLYSVFRCWSYYLLEVKLGIVESSAHRRPQKLPAASSRQEPDYATRFLSGMVQRHNISPGPYGASWVTLNYGAVPRRENGTWLVVAMASSRSTARNVARAFCCAAMASLSIQRRGAIVKSADLMPMASAQ